MMKYILTALLTIQIYASDLLQKVSDPTLDNIYNYYASLTPRECDIGEHMPLLRQLAQECETVTEIGVGGIISTWGLLKGLSENESTVRNYKGFDLLNPQREILDLARQIAQQQGIEYSFQIQNDLYLELNSVDFLFIDSMHTYCHLTYELETFAPKVRKYIALHDTSEPWGDQNDNEYRGNYSEYPIQYDRTKQGTWPAVVDFLARHPEWTLQVRYLNCHGFTILKRSYQ